MQYSSSSDDEAPDQAPNNVEPPLIRQPAETDSGSASIETKAEPTVARSKKPRQSSAEEKLAALEQSMEDPLKRLKAGRYKSSLLERVCIIIHMQLHLSNAPRLMRLSFSRVHAQFVSSNANRRMAGSQLLAKEIRRERNLVLQCIRYIVRHDFFDDDGGHTNLL